MINSLLPSTLLALSFIVVLSISSGAFATPDSSEISVADVNDQKRIDSIVQNFQHQLNRLGSNSEVLCDHIIEITVNGGHSYGANCTVSNNNKKLSVLMCDDMMIGKFTLGGSNSHSQEGISRFALNNCPPGG